MEDDFSNELKEIMNLITKYIDDNPDMQVVASFRDFKEDKDNLIMYQTSDNEDLYDMIDRLEGIIEESILIDSNEPYGKFFTFDGFTSSFN